MQAVVGTVTREPANLTRPLGTVRALLSARSQSLSPSLSKNSAQSHLTMIHCV